MKLCTSQAKVFIPLGVILLLVAIFGGLKIAYFLPPEPALDNYADYETWHRASAKHLNESICVFLVGFAGTIVLILTTEEEHRRRSDFRRIFGFDLLQQGQELVGDPQDSVSRRIETRRQFAQAFFREEIKLQNDKKLEPGEKELALNDAIRRKLEAKELFWEACNVAERWGYKVPKSINEPAS